MVLAQTHTASSNRETRCYLVLLSKKLPSQCVWGFVKWWRKGLRKGGEKRGMLWIFCIAVWAIPHRQHPPQDGTQRRGSDCCGQGLSPTPQEARDEPGPGPGARSKGRWSRRQGWRTGLLCTWWGPSRKQATHSTAPILGQSLGQGSKAPDWALAWLLGHRLKWGPKRCWSMMLRPFGALGALTAMACSLTVLDSFILPVLSERHSFLNVVWWI